MLSKLFVSIGVFLGFGLVANAQQVEGKVQSTRDCSNLAVHTKLVDLDKELEAEHYKMAFFTSGNMPSKDLMSVRLDCKAGEQYEIRLVLGENASRYQMNVIDPSLNHIIRLKAKTEGDDINVVKDHFTASKNGVYVIIYSQQNKDENCVGISVFKK